MNIHDLLHEIAESPTMTWVCNRIDRHGLPVVIVEASLVALGISIAGLILGMLL